MVGATPMWGEDTWLNDKPRALRNSDRKWGGRKDTPGLGYYPVGCTYIVFMRTWVPSPKMAGKKRLEVQASEFTGWL